VSTHLSAFLRLVHGLRPEWPRRLLAVGAPAEVVATIRADGIDVETADVLELGAWPEHAFDGVYLGQFEPTAERCAELFRVIHHGWAWAHVGDMQSAGRWRAELLLERGGLRLYQEADDALIVRTQLITPKIGAGGLVFDAEGRLLLCERADGQGWCIPGGVSDADEAPGRTAVREVFEEVGLEVEIDRLLGIYSARAPVGRIVVFEYLMRRVGGEPRQTDETLAWGWFHEHALPDPVFRKHVKRIGDAFAVRRGEAEPPFVEEVD
jgi:ADP-ribose pyrophosphatase YjhB (NUDIX family)